VHRASTCGCRERTTTAGRYWYCHRRYRRGRLRRYRRGVRCRYCGGGLCIYRRGRLRRYRRGSVRKQRARRQQLREFGAHARYFWSHAPLLGYFGTEPRRFGKRAPLLGYFGAIAPYFWSHASLLGYFGTEPRCFGKRATLLGWRTTRHRRRRTSGWPAVAAGHRRVTCTRKKKTKPREIPGGGVLARSCSRLETGHPYRKTEARLE